MSDPYQGTTHPFPAASPPPKNIIFPTPVSASTYNPEFHLPVTYDWNVTAEQQMTKSLIAKLSYVASHTSHLFTSVELNASTYIAGSKLTTDARRRYLPYSNIVESNMGGNGAYHSLQATIQQRLSHGASLLFNYTFSKALDNLPYASNNFFAQPGQSYVLPVYTPNYKFLDTGRSDFDGRHNVSGSYLWQLPGLHSGPRLLHVLINDWNMSGIVQAAAAHP